MILARVFSDELRIPSPTGATLRSSYRAARPGLDRGTRMLLLAAAGVTALLVAGMAGWALVGRAPTVVPVIEADARPLRVKPADPGGMQVVGADDQMNAGAASGTGNMAPVAETPAPQALRAQLAPPPAAPADTPLPDTPARDTSARDAPVARAVAPTPAPATPAAAAPAPARPAARTPARTGGTQVQLAAVETEAGARAEWQKLSRKMPDLLGARQLVLQKTEKDGKVFWRVRTGGFASTAEANGFCADVKSMGGACSLGF